METEIKIKNCPFCKGEIDTDAIKCKHCRADLRTFAQRHRNKLLVLFGIFLFLFAFTVISKNFSKRSLPSSSSITDLDYIKLIQAFTNDYSDLLDRWNNVSSKEYISSDFKNQEISDIKKQILLFRDSLQKITPPSIFSDVHNDFLSFINEDIEMIKSSENGDYKAAATHAENAEFLLDRADRNFNQLIKTIK